MLPEEKPSENPEQAPESAEQNARPDWLPEAYWNDTDGVAEVKKLVGSLSETQTALRNRKEQMREEIVKELEGDKPEGVESYKLDPTQMKMPEGLSVEMTEKDPILAKVKQWAFEQGVKPEAFTKLVDVYVNQIAESIPNKQKEIEALGENAEVRLDALTKMADKALSSKEEWNDFMLMTQTASQVQILEKLLQARPAPGPSDFEEGGVSNTTKEEIDRLMSTDAYWKGDTATVSKVQRLQERLSNRR